MFTRVLDLAVLALVAVAVLLPRPDVIVQPGLRLDDHQLLRVAELEATLGATPGALDPTLELTNLYIAGHRADWALAPLGEAMAKAPLDHRLYQRRALALAEHFEATAAFAAADRALALCEKGSSAPCDDTEHARLALVHRTLKSVDGLDMRKDPDGARVRIMQALRPTFIPAGKAPGEVKTSDPR